jgi:hypothetical protein
MYEEEDTYDIGTCSTPVYEEEDTCVSCMRRRIHMISVHAAHRMSPVKSSAGTNDFWSGPVSPLPL